MEEKIKQAIQILCDLITKDVSADDALKYTQAMLNLANTTRRNKGE